MSPVQSSDMPSPPPGPSFPGKRASTTQAMSKGGTRTQDPESGAWHVTFSPPLTDGSRSYLTGVQGRIKENAGFKANDMVPEKQSSVRRYRLCKRLLRVKLDLTLDRTTHAKGPGGSQCARFRSRKYFSVYILPPLASLHLFIVMRTP